MEHTLGRIFLCSYNFILNCFSWSLTEKIHSCYKW